MMNTNQPRLDLPDDPYPNDQDVPVEPLEEDNDTPFSEPTDSTEDTNVDLAFREDVGRLDPTHQATDNASDIDSQELYDEGLSGATEASEPNAGNAAVGYDPAKDRRRADHGKN